MIAQRLTFKVKPGNVERIVEMVNAERAKLNIQDRTRVYTANIGPFGVLVEELEFENLAEMEAFWAEWWARPETAAFMAEWNQLVDVGGGSEVWDLV